MLTGILEAEKRAKEEAAQAEKYRADAQTKVEEEKRKIITDALADAQEQVEKIRLSHEQSVAESLKALEEKCERDISRLKALEKENGERWVNEIASNAVGKAL